MINDDFLTIIFWKTLSGKQIVCKVKEKGRAFPGHIINIGTQTMFVNRSEGYEYNYVTFFFILLFGKYPFKVKSRLKH